MKKQLKTCSGFELFLLHVVCCTFVFFSFFLRLFFSMCHKSLFTDCKMCFNFIWHFALSSMALGLVKHSRFSNDCKLKWYQSPGLQWCLEVRWKHSWAESGEVHRRNKTVLTVAEAWKKMHHIHNDSLVYAWYDTLEVECFTVGFSLTKCEKSVELSGAFIKIWKLTLHVQQLSPCLKCASGMFVVFL